MRLFVVRHGRTPANAAGRLLGRANPSLDDVGREQAQAAADALAAVAAGARVVSSPLARTRETAALVAESCAADGVEIDERWIELDYGALEGALLADVDPEVWRRWRTDPDFAPEGGESLAAVGRRVHAACRDIAAGPDDRDVVVVTHVSPVKAALVWALGVDDATTWRTHVAPGSVTAIDVRAGGPILLSFNVTPGTLLR